MPQKSFVCFMEAASSLIWPLKAGAYDSVLWTTETPDVAQSYIPECGSKTFWSVSDYRKKETISPFFNREPTFDLQIAQIMGFDAKLCEGRGWMWNTQKAPTYGDVLDFLHNLGYTEALNTYGRYKLKTSMLNGKLEIFPANYKMPGKLFILTGKESLNLFDDSESEFHMMEPTYHRTALFRKLPKFGFDGIKNA